MEVGRQLGGLSAPPPPHGFWGLNSVIGLGNPMSL